MRFKKQRHSVPTPTIQAFYYDGHKLVALRDNANVISDDVSNPEVRDHELWVRMEVLTFSAAGHARPVTLIVDYEGNNYHLLKAFPDVCSPPIYCPAGEKVIEEDTDDFDIIPFNSADQALINQAKDEFLTKLAKDLGVDPKPIPRPKPRP